MYCVKCDRCKKELRCEDAYTVMDYCPVVLGRPCVVKHHELCCECWKWLREEIGEGRVG